MARFEILGGHHVDPGSGKVTRFEKGRRSYVESDQDLDEMFKNKFRRVEEATRVRADSDRADLSGGKVTDSALIIRTKNEKLKKKAMLAAQKAADEVMKGKEDEEFDEDDSQQFTDLTVEGNVSRKKKVKLVPTDELDEDTSDDDTPADTDDEGDDEVDLTEEKTPKMGVAAPAAKKGAKATPAKKSGTKTLRK